TSDERRAVFRAALVRFHRTPVSEQHAICAHLGRLDRLVPLVGRFGRRFTNLSPEARRKCLQACERSRWPPLAEGHAQLSHLVQMAFMECTGVWPETARTSDDGAVSSARPAGRAV